MAHWLRLRYMVGASVTSIVRGMSLPIGIGVFPGMKTMHAWRIHRNPNVARSEVIILAAHYPDVFSPVPNIGFRNWGHRCYHDRWRNNNGCCGRRPGMRQSERNSHHCHGDDRRKVPFHIQFLSIRSPCDGYEYCSRRRRASPKFPLCAMGYFAFRNPQIGNSQSLFLSFINWPHIIDEWRVGNYTGALLPKMNGSLPRTKWA